MSWYWAGVSGRKVSRRVVKIVNVASCSLQGAETQECGGPEALGWEQETSKCWGESKEPPEDSRM